ncbi:MAG: hypothetical protein F6K54_23205, partial [Okeania sp. SIO3B5]|uniref:hypothetical protein n=1 Tax=Okeania sp. SIO3B5 TaxID=2607811 RepID=UPI0013FE9BDD
MARIYGYQRKWGSGSHGLWHGYTDIKGSGGVGEWLTRIMARIYGYQREWGSRGVGEWLTRIMARIYGYQRKWGSRGVAHTDYGTDIR